MLTFAWTPYGDLVLASPLGLWVTDHEHAAQQTASGRSAVGSGRSPVSLGTGAPTDGPAGRRLLWELIVTAQWAGDVLTVTAAEQVAPQIMKRLPPVRLPLPEPGDLPRVVRQRVDRSVAISHRRPLSSGGTVLLVARRASGRDGLLWYAVFDRDSDADDEPARTHARSMLEAAVVAQAPRPYLD